MTYASANPYEIWDSRTSLGMARDVIPQYQFWLPQFAAGRVGSEDEWVDFTKLPADNRKLAPFVMPMSSGKPIYTDRATAYRFKPAYIKLKDAVHPKDGLRKIPGIDEMLSPNNSGNSIMARRAALKAAIVRQHVRTIQRRWEWMAAQAIINGTIVISGEEYPAVTLDFGRNSNQTITLGAGSRWGDSGISILGLIQTWADLMSRPTQNSDGTGGFGGFPVQLIVGSRAWAAMRVDPEIKDLMNKFYPGNGTQVERGLISSDKVVKVGQLGLGGTSGVTIDVILYQDSYVDDTGTEQLFLQPTDAVLVSSPAAIGGFQCFGAILDPYSNYQPLDIFARNWLEEGDPAAEYLLHQSSPLMVPTNPNATLKATVVA